MSRFYRIYFSTAGLLIASIACAVPAIPAAPATATPIDLNLAIEQTVAALTFNAPTSTASTTPLPTGTSTFTPEPPTPTETPTFGFTATTSITVISVSVSTNCRTGPGKDYDVAGSLLVGEFAEVFGVDPTNKYWYIRNPDGSPEFCWVWGEFATLTGPAEQIPVYTPLPTLEFTLTSLPTSIPTSPPTFNAEYINIGTCNGQWWVNIRLKNTSTVVFRYVFISLKDKLTNETQIRQENGLSNRSDCGEGSTKGSLAPGETYRVSSPVFSHDLKGHEIKATVTLCSEADKKGHCSTRGVGVIP